MCVADLYAISQPTISRIWRRILPLLDEILAMEGISLEEAVAEGEPVLIDGTFVPTGNRPASGEDTEKDLYSGKHHVQCLNIQVARTLYDDLIATSDPVPGRRQDSAALRLCGWDQVLAGSTWIADTVYIGAGAIPPIKKTSGA
jgi:hypothetical protein